MKLKLESLINLVSIILATAGFLLTSCTSDPKSAGENNTPPVAYDKNISVIKSTEENPTSRLIELEAYDRDGDVLVFRILRYPANGSLVKINANTWRFRPDLDFENDDYFTYAANDGYTDSNTATVNLRVGVANHPPKAYGTADYDYNKNDTYNPLSVSKNGSIEITLFAEDQDPGDNERLTYHAEQPKNGKCLPTADKKTYTYVPNSDYGGADSFTFYVNDGYENSNSATIYLTVGYDNIPPEASDFTIDTMEDESKGWNFAAVDPNIGTGDYIKEYVLNSRPSNGAVTEINSTGGNFIYTPNPDFYGTDSFTYYATDSSGVKSNVATVTVIVSAVNDAPVASDFTVAAMADSPRIITLPAGDVDNDILTLTYSVNPENYDFNDKVTFTSGNQCTYAPDPGFYGTDKFYYQVSDGTDSAVGDVTVVVTEEGIVFVNSALAESEQQKDGSCWDLAFKTIQEAIDSLKGAEIGETWQIWVAGNATGYTPSLLNPDCIAEIADKDITLLIYGGFEGIDEVDINQRIRDTNGALTNRPVINAQNSALHCLITNGNITLDGFTIQGGNAAGNNENGFGGGIYAASGTLTLNDVFFINNSADCGGAVYAEDSTNITLKNCGFYSNTASKNGGAIFGADNSRILIGAENPEVNSNVNCWFGDSGASNTANTGGAVFAAQYSSLDIINSNFSYNRASISGGALFAASLNRVSGAAYPFKVSNCRFNDNKSASIGGAASVIGKASFTNCLFNSNSAGINGGAINNASSTNLQFTACTFSQNNANTVIDGTIENGNGGAIYNSGCMEVKGRSEVNPDTGEISLYKTLFTGNAAGIDGGAIYNANGGINANSITITECDFTGGNNAGNSGGAVCNDRVSPLFSSLCNFTGNRAPYGGAISNKNGAGPVFYGCEIRSNNAFVTDINTNYVSGELSVESIEGGSGGAVFNDTGSAAEFNQCIISGNKALNGGAICNAGASIPKFFECSINDNITNENYQNYKALLIKSAGYNGGAIFNDTGSLPEFNDCIISGNTAHRGGAVYNTNSAKPIFFGCDIYDNVNMAYDPDPDDEYSGYYCGNGAVAYDNTAVAKYVNCLIHANGTGDYTDFAIIYSYNAYTKLINCTIADNHLYDNILSEESPVLYLDNKANAIIINTIFRNSNTEYEIQTAGESTVEAKNNCIIFRSTYSWYNTGANTANINANPGLTNGYYLIDSVDDVTDNITDYTTSPPDVSQENYTEANQSPCINSGLQPLNGYIDNELIERIKERSSIYRMRREVTYEVIIDPMFGEIRNPISTVTLEQSPRLDEGVIDIGYHYKIE